MKTLANVPVLVTGGAGFIGSHLVEYLVNQRAHVTVLDNLSTGSLKNLSEILNVITFVEGSITDLELCKTICTGKEYIFHLAAYVSVPESMQNPTACYETNVIGTLNLLQAAVFNNVKRFIFSSSSAVYGSHQGICHEETVCKPESPYGHSKLLGELLCKQFAQHHPIKTVMLRYFNVWGARQNPAGSYAAVVAKFTDCMRNNIPLTIFGDGLQQRDFVPVKTVVAANYAAALMPMKNWEIINVATGKSITLLMLIDELKKNFQQFNAGITFMPARNGDIYCSQADCTKLKALLKESKSPFYKNLS